MAKIKSKSPNDQGAKINLLVDFGHQILRENRLEYLLELIANKVRDILDAERCSLFLYDKRKHELWSQVAHGMEGHVLRFPADKGIIGHVAQKLITMNIKNASQSKYFNPEEDRKTGYKTKTILAIPLKSHANQLLGVFEVLNKRTGTFTKEDEGLLALLSNIAAAAIENAQLYAMVRQSHLETILRLAMVIEVQNQTDLEGHLKRISQYSSLIADAMSLPKTFVEALQFASPLYDIGKIAMPDRILKKSGHLNHEETRIMHEHPTRGAKILQNADSEILKIAFNIAYAHHERYDGTGYPRGLVGNQIPLEARIVALADAFDEATSKRAYKDEWDLENTLSYIREQAGKQFDPQVVAAFFKCLPTIRAILEKQH